MEVIDMERRAKKAPENEIRRARTTIAGARRRRERDHPFLTRGHRPVDVATSFRPFAAIEFPGERGAAQDELVRAVMRDRRRNGGESKGPSARA